MNRLLGVLLVAGVVTAPQPAQAQVFVDYTVSGAAGAWLLDFRVSNEFPPSINQGFYFFGVSLGGGSYSASPLGWSQWNVGAPYTSSSDNVYNVNWFTTPPAPSGPFVPGAAVTPGASLGGFVASLSTESAPTSVSYFAFSQGPDWVDGDFGTGPNPGFEGVALGHAVSVPEPSTYLLLLAGIMGLGLVAWRRSEELA